MSRKAFVGLLTGLAHPWALPVFVLWIGAIVCAFVFVKRFRNETKALDDAQVKAGRRLYIASVAVSYIMTPIFFLSITHWGCAMFVSDESKCERNIRALAKAVQQYAADNNDTLPPALPWTQTLVGYVQQDQSTLKCPYATGPHSYAYNESVAGKKLIQLESEGSTVVVFESDHGEKGVQSDLSRERHDGRLFLGLADGHSKRYVPGTSDFKPIWNQVDAQ